ncbi:DnaJ subfamily C member 16 [Merluccius polli]|uniref:DnaJ homolog subfamily C member 16 n=1 Tax=Merluccius polli TaxID=89951 RepID=A0AA47M3C3_MERPO|nr:DnaJ subfamily C member 16 [Merluccius polli]
MRFCSWGQRSEEDRMSLPHAVVVVLLLLLAGSLYAAAEVDPYKILGVTRSASQAEIKKVYKRLAKEWHPDKNKSPEAEDMFIKITKSYEILSNEEKRSTYDRYGQTDDTQPYGHHGQYRHRHGNFDFDEAFFNFPFNKNSRDFADGKYALHFDQYVNDVVPGSFKRPYLIKITSDWCFSCIHIEPVWKEVVQEMETLGVGIGVVDVGYERRLANHLGAHRTPSILGVINGKVTFFHYAVAKELLKQFVEDLLPQRLVEKVTDKNELEFLNSWHEINKPHVLLFDQVPAVPLLFKLTAFAYKDYLHFGYVDQGISDTANLLKQFNINTYAPTMLVFKENIDKPADIIQAKGMKKQIIDEFVSNNKFLLVPRLVNQKLFDELCPVKQFHRRRKYCVLLMTSDEESFSPGNQAFLSFASTNTKEVLRFAYVYQRLQQPLCDALMQSKESTPWFSQVVILERRNAAGKTLYKPVTAWNGSEEDQQALVDELERLRKDPSILNYDATLPELNNEFASLSARPLSEHCVLARALHFTNMVGQHAEVGTIQFKHRPRHFMGLVGTKLQDPIASIALAAEVAGLLEKGGVSIVPPLLESCHGYYFSYFLVPKKSGEGLVYLGLSLDSATMTATELPSCQRLPGFTFAEVCTSTMHLLELMAAAHLVPLGLLFMHKLQRRFAPRGWIPVGGEWPTTPAAHINVFVELFTVLKVTFLSPGARSDENRQRLLVCPQQLSAQYAFHLLPLYTKWALSLSGATTIILFHPVAKRA